MRRNQKEEDLRENHPYFDRPLFAVPRESKFRKICQTIVNARYDPKLKARKYRLGTHTHETLITYIVYMNLASPLLGKGQSEYKLGTYTTSC